MSRMVLSNKIFFFVAVMCTWSTSLLAEEEYSDDVYKKLELNFHPRNRGVSYQKFFGDSTPLFGDMLSSFANRVTRQDVKRTQILFGSGETYHFDGMNLGIFYGDSETYGLVYRKNFNQYITVFLSAVTFVEDYRLRSYYVNNRIAFEAIDKSFYGYSVGFGFDF